MVSTSMQCLYQAKPAPAARFSAYEARRGQAMHSNDSRALQQRTKCTR